MINRNKVTHAGCWSHARRVFSDILKVSYIL
ncbi:IS66 family transposase [Niallia circulans]|nr:transposase [Niallia circulans]NRG34091.1 transposase [Niallia circulans]